MKKLSTLTIASLLTASLALPAYADGKDFLFGVGAGVIGKKIYDDITGNKKKSGSQSRSSGQPSAMTAQQREENKEVQARLNQLGYDAGPVDGVFGGKTRAAIKSFQSSLGEQATGKLTNGQIAALYQATSNGQPSAQPAPTYSPAAAQSATPQPVQTYTPPPMLMPQAPAGHPEPQQVYAPTPQQTQAAISNSGKHDVYGVYPGLGSHEAMTLLQGEGFTECSVENARTLCTMENDMINDNVAFLTHENTVVGVFRLVSFKQPIKRELIEGKLKETYQDILATQNKALTDNEACAQTYLTNPQALYDKVKFAVEASEQTAESSLDCSNFYGVKIAGEENVEQVTLSFFETSHLGKSEAASAREPEEAKTTKPALKF